MKFDKLSLFADGKSIPTTASTSTYSKVIDCRLNGQIGIDGFLRIWAGVVGTVNATGSVTTKFQTSADGKTWTDLYSEVQNGDCLMKMFVPCKGVKRFIRLVFAVGATALGSAITVKAGLVDQFDIEDLKIQTFPPLEDLTPLADQMAKALTVAETTKTVTKGSSEDIVKNDGFIASYEAPAGYTVTFTDGLVNIALAATAASGTVVLIDGLGNKVSIAVTAA